MKVALVYIGVVVIWSTTPIAIKWSNHSLSFMSAVSVRMLLAACLCVIALIVLRKKLIQSRSDWLAMLAGAIGLFPNMALVYWCAQYIPTGLISVILGVYPFAVGGFSIFILKENLFTFSRIFALLVALLGLLLIHIEQMQFGDKAVLGVLGMLIATLFFAASTVWLKAVGGGLEPLRQLTGTLLIATPCFIVTWFVFDGELPDNIDIKSIIGVVYLILAGSIAGGLGFYYVLKHCNVSSVALIPLITPVIALLLGFYIENELLSTVTLWGCLLILISLSIYLGLLKRLLVLLKGWNAMPS